MTLRRVLFLVALAIVADAVAILLILLLFLLLLIIIIRMRTIIIHTTIRTPIRTTTIVRNRHPQR